jgi:hypothetical protein
VPILSLLQLHVQKLLCLDQEQFKEEQKKHHQIITGLHSAQKEKAGSILGLISSCLRRDIDTSFLAMRVANCQIIKYVLMFFGTLLGVLVFGLNMSWNLLSFDPYGGMEGVLAIGTIVFQVSFFSLTVAGQERNSIWVFIDLVIVSLSVFADWHYFASGLWGNFASHDLFYFSILTLYMIFRFWITLLKATDNPIQRANNRGKGFEVQEKVHLVWTTRSTTLISQLLPDFENIWNLLVNKFGEDFAKEVMEITICCTSKDKEVCDDLELEVQNGPLGRLGALKFQRPMLSKILEEHTMARINDADMPASRTLIAFCGSPQLADRVKEAKILNDLAMFVAGREQHQMDLVIESYGGEKPKSQEQKVLVQNDAEDAVLKRPTIQKGLSKRIFLSERNLLTSKGTSM